MPNTQDIKRRIRSVKNTRQITKAMEMVAAAKMRRAQQQALATRTYANLAWELLQRASRKGDPRVHRLLRAPKGAGKAGILLITSNRGLIGSFNNNIINTALGYVRDFENVEFVTLGKRGRDAMRRRGYEIAADFDKSDAVYTVASITALAGLLVDDFVAGRYDRVTMVYMDFVSTLAQKPHILELLPLNKSADATLGGERVAENTTEYLFEPTADQVLNILLPRLVTMQIYQALLETNAAEHSARMIAMKNASESASDLTHELTLEYNKIRQAGITKEISEIVGGRLALEN